MIEEKVLIEVGVEVLISIFFYFYVYLQAKMIHKIFLVIL